MGDSNRCAQGVVSAFHVSLPGRAGWKLKPVQKNKMTANILRQEELIAQKKREIEAKMAEQAKNYPQTPNKPVTPRYVS